MPKGFIPYLLILIILAGIAVAVYLTQFTQIFKPHAQEADISFESHYNPFGDPWSNNLGPNPDIPVALTTGCYRRGPKWVGRETDPAVSDQEIEYLSKSNVPVIFEECALVQRGSGLNKERLINIATKLKEKNPRAKYIGYFVLHAPDYSGLGFGEIPQGADNDENCGTVKCETFFVHKKGFPATKENRFSAGGYQLLDITNPYYRQYIAPRVAQALNEMNMDGFLADGISSTVPIPASVDSSQIPDEIKNLWGLAYMDLFRDVKAAIGPNKLLFANISGQSQDFIRGVLSNENSTGAPRADGIMWEDPIGPVNSDIKRLQPGGITQLETINRVLDIVSQLSKYMMFVVNTNANCPDPAGKPADYCFNNTNRQKELAFQRYYLAAYLNLFRNEKIFLNYYTPLKTGPQFDAETYFKDWNVKVGSPLGISEEIAPGVYLRKFQKAHVYWNSSTAPYQIHFGSCCSLITLDGVRVEDYTLQAKSGMIFGGSPAFDFPSPSPSPIPSPSLSPSPSPLSNFSLYAPVVSCIGPNSPRVRLNWSALPGTNEYQVLFRQQPGDNEIRLGTTSGTSYDMEESQGLIPGRFYGFIVAVSKPSGTVYSNSSWSDRPEVYGWTEVPTCAPNPSSSPGQSPSPSPSFSPSPSPSASSVKKTGDIDNDGDVDIFDYNVFVQDYGSSNLRSDLNNNGSIDIFDFNLLIQNFGT